MNLVEIMCACVIPYEQHIKKMLNCSIRFNNSGQTTIARKLLTIHMGDFNSCLGNILTQNMTFEHFKDCDGVD